MTPENFLILTIKAVKKVLEINLLHFDQHVVWRLILFLTLTVWTTIGVLGTLLSPCFICSFNGMLDVSFLYHNSYALLYSGDLLLIASRCWMRNIFWLVVMMGKFIWVKLIVLFIQRKVVTNKLLSCTNIMLLYILNVKLITLASICFFLCISTSKFCVYSFNLCFYFVVKMKSAHVFLVKTSFIPSFFPGL